MAVFKLSQAFATVLVSSLAIVGSAKAADFSFTGNLSTDNPVQFFGLSLNTESTVSLRTYSYAGGTQANGNTVSAGGFDPIVSLFRTGTSPASFLSDNDDGVDVAVDPTSGFAFDSLLPQSLSPGNYAVSISTYPNFAPLQSGYTPNGRSSNWALDILNVASANTIAPISVTGPGPVPVSMKGL